jgi:hypothetical protein
MRRLISFSVVAILIARTELDFLPAVGMFLFFAVNLGILRFVASLVLAQGHTWTAWRERITQIVVLEGAAFGFLYIHDFMMPLEWWGNGTHTLLVTLEALPSLIFLFLSWGIVKVRWAWTKGGKAQAPICGECGSIMNAVPVTATGFECPGCGATSGLK